MCCITVCIFHFSICIFRFPIFRISDFIFTINHVNRISDSMCGDPSSNIPKEGLHMESNEGTYDVKERRNMLARQRRASMSDAQRESNNITRRTRRAECVALQRDKEGVAHRHADSTLDQQIVDLQTNQQSNASENQIPTFTNLPQGRHPFDGKNDRLRHQMGQMSIRCAHCDALHWIEERIASSPRRRPNFTACCSCGKVSLPPLAQPPSPLRDLLEGQTAEAKQFRNHICLHICWCQD